ncbi:transcriptional regulator [Spirochaetia bacterium]|nr:transcriptional regulator [Spirochaetia bacterium]GHV21088.1 transcriptional regulator [Spirochaetia bacterium]
MTIKEIAELANTSIGTVDRVINNRGRVSAETRKKIEEIIERYHFTPNPIAKRLQRRNDYRLCALLPQGNQDAGFWRQALSGIRNAGESISPLGVKTEIFEYDRYNFESFRNISDTVLKKKPDGLILAPVMPEKTKPFLDKLDVLGIPYVFFDADIPDASPLCVVGHDPFKGGYLAGRLMHLFIGRHKIERPLGVLDAHGEDYHVTRRRDGFLSYADKWDFPTIAMEYSGYRGLEISENEIEHFLRTSPDLSGVFITNCMAHQVAAARLHNTANHDVFIIGYDLLPENRRLLEEGCIDAIISQHSEEQSRTALLALYRHVVLKQNVPSRIDIPLEIYLKENVPNAKE